MQARFSHNGIAIDYTPAAAVSAGDVVVQNGIPCVAKLDIAADALGSLTREGVFEVAKVTGAVTALSPLYWDEDGDPLGGTAGTGAITTVAADGVFFGFASAAAAETDETVFAILCPEAGAALLAQSVDTIAAAGTVQADATLLSYGFNKVTGADATKGVKLPPAVAGRTVTIKNADAAILKVWPSTGDGINAVAVNSNATMAASTAATYHSFDGTTWFSVPLVPS